jgi:hypothetical protein
VGIFVTDGASDFIFVGLVGVGVGVLRVHLKGFNVDFVVWGIGDVFVFVNTVVVISL